MGQYVAGVQRFVRVFVIPLKESSGSQFYIVQNEAACSALDGDYTVFGETISGLDVIDRIAGVETDQRDCPVSEVKIVSIRLDKDALPKSE